MDNLFYISNFPLIFHLFTIFFFRYSMGLTLHQHSHSHSGSVTSHSHETSGTSRSNINVRAAYIHVLGDIIQSLGVLVAAVIIYFRVSNLDPSYTCHSAHFLWSTPVKFVYVLVKFDTAIQFNNVHILLSAYRNCPPSLYICVFNMNIIYIYTTGK